MIRLAPAVVLVGLVSGLVCGTLSGCAAKAPRPVPGAEALATARAEVAQADGLVARGCYRCLLDAMSLYERAAARTQPPLDVARQRWSTAVLLALREKELGLPASRWLDLAAALAGPDDEMRLKILRAAPWERAGGSVEFDGATRPAPDERNAWKAALTASAPGSFLDQYLLVTVFCSITPGPPILEPLPLDLLDVSRPLLQYRVGTCNSAQRAHLEDALQAEPRFVEAQFFLGRYELGSLFARRDWLTRALPLLSAAHDGLPEVPLVAISYGGALRSRGALARAVALYDEALAIRPAQREALLGRTIALTYLARQDEAIATATRMLELGTWYLGDAYYWRALNHYQKGELADAATDVANARRTLVHADVMTLSGQIAYDQQRRADARADFTEARRLDSQICTAAWYLGLIEIDEQAWRPAVNILSEAARCYSAAADAFRTERETLPEDLPEDARVQQAADFDRRITDSLRQAARSSFNAAQASLRLGDTASALTYARSAAAHEDMRDRAETLIRSLERR